MIRIKSVNFVPFKICIKRVRSVRNKQMEYIISSLMNLWHVDVVQELCWVKLKVTYYNLEHFT